MVRLGSLARGACLAALAPLAACAVPPTALPPAPAHSNGQVLWNIVHDRCVPNQIEHGSPGPCAGISLEDGVERGYAILKDRNGIAQYLVMPTTPITGIEDSRVLAPGAPNYFAVAWRARHLVEERLGARLPREDVGIAVNSQYGRSQDLLHLHVDCLRADVRDALRRAAPRIGRGWSRDPLRLAGHRYRALRIDGDETVETNPFGRLAAGLAVPAGEMGAWTLILVGARFENGQPGFILLAARADPAMHDGASGEILQDHACTGRTRP